MLDAQQLDQTSEELIAALEEHTGRQATTLHTGGGCMVAAIDLTQDGRYHGRQVWLTREADVWLIGFYDFDADDGDEGICLELRGFNTRRTDPNGSNSADDPRWVAEQVAGILRRVGAPLELPPETTSEED